MPARFEKFDFDDEEITPPSDYLSDTPSLPGFLSNYTQIEDFLTEKIADQPIRPESTSQVVLPDAFSAFDLLSTFRRRRSIGFDLRNYYGFEKGSKKQEEIQSAPPLPERGEHEQLTDYLCRIMTSTDRSAFEADLQPAQDTLCELYSDDPKAVNAIKKEADVLRWRFFGQPNDALPAGIYLPRTSDRVELAQYAFTKELDAAIAVHSAELVRNLSGNKKEIQDIVAEAVRQTPLYAYMESFGAPSTRRVMEELPLDQNQRARRAAEITLDLTRQYGVTVEELQRPTGGDTFNAHRQYVRAVSALDYEVEPQVRLEKGDLDEDPYDRLMKAVRHDIAKQWSEKYGRPATLDDVVITFGERSVRGKTIFLDSYLDAIVSRFDDPYGMQDLLTGSLLHSMVGIAQLETGRRPYLEVLEQVTMSFASMSLPELFKDGWSAPIHLQKQVWIRRPLLPPPSPYRVSLYKPAGAETQSPLTSRELARHLHTSIGEVLYDNRQDNRPRLIIDTPRPDDFMSTNEQPDLTIAVASIEPKTMLAIPGFSVSAISQEKGRTIFDFIKDKTGDPYEACTVAIPSEALGRIASLYLEQGFRELAEVIKNSNDITVEGLAAIVRQNSVYNVDAKNNKSVEIMSGQPLVQCVGADELLRKGLNAAFGNCTRGINGYVLLDKSSSDISALRHRQTMFIHNGRRYILDATPDLESSMERISELQPGMTDNLGDYPLEASAHCSTQHQSTPESAPQISPQEAARNILENATAAAEVIRNSFEASIRARLGIIDDPRFEQREDLYDYILALSPKPEDPLRSTFMTMLDTVRTANPEMLAIESSQRAIASNQAIVTALQDLPLKERFRYGNVIDDAMLSTLSANLRRLSSHLESVHWALKTLD